MKGRIIVDAEKTRIGDADVDSVILQWSKTGVLASAGQNAIKATHSMGNAVTIVENNIVYRYLPDGTKQELRRLPIRAKKKEYPTGVAMIRK